MGNISKVPVPIAFVESELGTDKQNVEIAVVVIVQKGAAVADGLKDGEGRFAGDSPAIAQAVARGDIGKSNWAFHVVDRRQRLILHAWSVRSKRLRRRNIL